jgi:hypothetical protein
MGTEGKHDRRREGPAVNRATGAEGQHKAGSREPPAIDPYAKLRQPYSGFHQLSSWLRARLRRR